jgi:hypothetical protein
MNSILLDQGLAPFAAEILRHNGFMEWNGPTTSRFWRGFDRMEECP